ncbi:MAG TPA: hypothetical protein VGR87_06815 [Candidatus Limnocylindria bacterium]|jgi:hypothetical protein|nr:hypothetical protein [Candidatus Limnocylindria bacterium]
MTTLLTATAFLALLFGIGQALIPGVLLSAFGVKLDVNADLFARTLGGTWLGYALLNWRARTGEPAFQRAVVTADFIVAVFGAVISLIAISIGTGSGLMWVWVALFAVFGAWQAYVLWVPTRPDER